MNTSNLRSYDTFDEVLSAGPLHHHGHFPDQFPILWSTTSSPRSRFTSWSTSSLTFLSVLINDLILVCLKRFVRLSIYFILSMIFASVIVCKCFSSSDLIFQGRVWVCMCGNWGGGVLCGRGRIGISVCLTLSSIPTLSLSQ